MRYIYSIAAFFCLILPLSSGAQYIADFMDTGDEFFEQKDYYAAAVYYQKALDLLPDESYYLPYNMVVKANKKKKKDAEKYQDLIYRMGEAFRLYKDYESAESWYEKVLNFNNDRFPLARLWYGVTLRANKRYDKALEELESFKDHYDQQDQYSKRADLEIASVKFAQEQVKYPRLAELTKLESPLNVEEGSDYAPIRIGDTLFFTSSRKIEKVDPRRHSPFINKVYRSIIGRGDSLSNPERLELTSGKYTEEAAASPGALGHRLYFTQWTQLDPKSDSGHHVITLIEQNADGHFEQPTILGEPINIEGANSREANLTPDGKYLIFASDRSGGQGGYDLWFCRMDESGKPVGEAQNIGSQINTEGDELNPYFDEKNEELVFSSDGRIGMGGFDLYTSKGDFSSNSWSEPQNMGYPVNSSKDDNYFFPDITKENGFYTSSDRNSVCCLDLYEGQLRTLKLIGHVYDEDTHEVIDQVELVLRDSITHRELSTQTTTSEGDFDFPLENRRPLKIHMSHNLYGEKDVEITHAELEPVDSVYERDIYWKIVGKPIRIDNIYYNFDRADLRPDSKPALDSLVNLLQEHLDWNVEIGAHTDSIGSEDYNQWLSQKRAQSVVDFLIAHGVSQDRLEAKGYGEERPIAPNSNPDGSDNAVARQLNRRTEFTIKGFIRLEDKIVDELKSNVGEKSQIEVDRERTKHMSKIKADEDKKESD